MYQNDEKLLKQFHAQGLSKEQALEKLKWSPRTFHYRVRSLGLEFPKHHQVKRKQIARDIAKLAGKGMTLDQIIERLGIKRTYFYEVKREFEIPVATKKGLHSKRQLERVRALKAQGLVDAREIAKAMKLSVQATVAYLKKI